MLIHTTETKLSFTLLNDTATTRSTSEYRDEQHRTFSWLLSCAHAHTRINDAASPGYWPSVKLTGPRACLPRSDLHVLEHTCEGTKSTVVSSHIKRMAFICCMAQARPCCLQITGRRQFIMLSTKGGCTLNRTNFGLSNSKFGIPAHGSSSKFVQAVAVGKCR